jgi:hypothetical protein
MWMVTVAVTIGPQGQDQRPRSTVNVLLLMYCRRTTPAGQEAQPRDARTGGPGECDDELQLTAGGKLFVMPLFQRGQVVAQRWQILRRCGEGQFSEVYEVRESTAGKDATRVGIVHHPAVNSMLSYGCCDLWDPCMEVIRLHCAVGNEGGEAEGDAQHQAGAQGQAQRVRESDSMCTTRKEHGSRSCFTFATPVAQEESCHRVWMVCCRSWSSSCCTCLGAGHQAAAGCLPSDMPCGVWGPAAR